MRKLKLELEELHVESFDTSPGRGAGRGTVLGNAAYAGAGDDAVVIGVTDDKEDLPLSYIIPGCTLSSCPTQDKTCFNTECGTCVLDDTCMTGCFDTCPSGGIICCA